MRCCAGIVLAGGLATRMGGRDKALLPLAGRPLLVRAVERLSPQVDRLAVNSNAPASSLPASGFPVVADADGRRSGPLAGVLAGLRWAASLEARPAAIVTVAVDTPFFPVDLADRLWSSSDEGGRIAMASSVGQAHPTFALWPIDLGEDLARFIADGSTLKVSAFAARHGVERVEFGSAGEPDPFFNINTPEDLAVAEAAIGRMP